MSTGTLDSTLATIWRSYNGIKHTWYPDGWPFSDKVFNKRLMLKPNQKVVFLHRRNLLRRLISAHISLQTNIWGSFNKQEKERVANFSFGPMNPDEVNWRLDWESRMVALHRQLLADHGISFLEIWYEDLYNPEAEMRERIDGLNSLFAFLGERPLDPDHAPEELKRLFDSHTSKLNSTQNYLRIPGIHKVEKLCGSDRTGWVFRD